MRTDHAAALRLLGMPLAEQRDGWRVRRHTVSEAAMRRLTEPPITTTDAPPVASSSGTCTRG
jgi:hypothetical protein